MRTGLSASVASHVGFVNQAFGPRLLFQNGEQGWWYDPSDFSTLFQDATGTTPVTAVEQPCGLMLDKRLGLVLGPELVTNGNFATDSDWTKGTGWTIDPASNSAIKSAGTAAALTQTISSTAGKFYLVTIFGRAFLGTVTVSIGTGGSSFTFTGGPATFRRYIFAGTSTQTLSISGDASFLGFVQNVSVRELPGNHAYTPAAASTARPTVSARVNLLTKTEQFDDAVWVKSATTALTSGVLDPFGGSSAFTVAASGGSGSIQQIVTVTSGVGLSASIWIRRRTGSGSIFMRCGDLTPITITITNNWTRVLVSATPTSTTGRMAVTINTDGDAVDIYGADLRVANDGVGIPAYQRVNTATDYDTVGFPVYLRADGSNDYMLTNSIDFTGTDKMTVCAGVRKLSDATIAILSELSVSRSANNGSFTILAPGGPGTNYTFVNKGTLESAAIATVVAPATNVITSVGDISGDSAILRVNGAQAASSTSDQGTGNYGNYQMFLFMRAGTSLPFNGRFYGGVVRGAQSNTQQIAALEGYMNSKTKAYV